QLIGESAVMKDLRLEIERVTSSLPTPLSPVTSTLASDLATRSISSRRSFITALSPINCPDPFFVVIVLKVLPFGPSTTLTACDRRRIPPGVPGWSHRGP